MNRRSLLLTAVLVEGGLGLLGLVLMRFAKMELESRVSLTWGATGSALVLCLPLLAMLFLSEQLHWEPLSRLTSELDEKVIPIFAESKLPDLALMAFLAGVGEELVFRGWLQGVLSVKFGVWAGIMIASAIFGLAHYLSATYAVYAGLTGLYLGVIYQVSGNLYIVMAIHALYDFIALVYLIEKGKCREAGIGAVE